MMLSWLQISLTLHFLPPSHCHFLFPSSTLLPLSFTQEIRLPDDIHVDHVASGSAHSVAWSSVKRKAVCKLPEKVPMEFNHLQTIPMLVLRNRLIMLHYFSNMFCKSLTLFGLQSRHSETAPGGHEGVFEGFDRLRSILLSSAKVNLVDKLFFTQLRLLLLIFSSFFIYCIIHSSN